MVGGEKKKRRKGDESREDEIGKYNQNGMFREVFIKAKQSILGSNGLMPSSCSKTTLRPLKDHSKTALRPL